jgi:hypothetical protein
VLRECRYDVLIRPSSGGADMAVAYKLVTGDWRSPYRIHGYQTGERTDVSLEPAERAAPRQQPPPTSVKAGAA